MSIKSLLRLVVVAVGLLGTNSCVGQLGVDSVESEVALPPPTNLTVVNVRSDRQDLSWDPSPGADRYIILRGFAPGTETSYTTCCLSGPPFIANHLTANTQYCWEVENVNSAGQRSAPSNEICLTTPGTIMPPTGVSAQPISSSAISVSWSGVSGAVKYYINQSANGGPYTRVGAVLDPTLMFTSAGLQANTQYCYTIQAEDAGTNDSAASSPAACTTTLLAGLEGFWKFDEQGGSVANDSSGLGRSATLASGASFTTLDKAPIDDDKSMLSISSSDSAGATTAAVPAFRLTGAFSIVFWANVPTTASNVIFLGMHNAGSCGAGALGWEVSQDSTGLNFISQTGTRSFGTSLSPGVWTHVGVTYPGGAGGTMHLYLNGVEVANGPYTASNSLQSSMTIGHVGGCAGGAVVLDQLQIYSRELSASELAVLGTVPLPPTGLTLTKNTSTVQNFSWTPPAGGADKWIILRGVGPTAPGNEVPYTHAPNPPTSFNGDHLMPSTQYAWEVRTVQNGLLSDPSAELVATTADPPAAPTNVTATAVSQTRINVSWDAVSTATKYYIFMSTGGGAYVAKGSVLAPTTAFQAVNLTANTTYSFEIQAEDAGLTRSPMSAPATATTLP